MLENIKKIIAEQLSLDVAEIGPDTSFKDDLEADSLDLFEVIMSIEEEYDVEIPPEEVSNLNTVAEVMDYLKEKGIEE